MISVEIGFGNVLMARSALTHDSQLEAGKVGPYDGVRRMAVIAMRQLRHSANAPLFVVRVSHLGVHAILVFLIDAVVTSTACTNDVVPAHRGLGIARWKFLVCRMAIRARGRHGQAAGQQPATVDALRVVFDDVLLGAEVTHGRRRSFPMAFRAEAGHVAAERARLAHFRL